MKEAAQGKSGEVVVAYSGVHQAYQIALAAHESDLLNTFYCSFLARGAGARERLLSRAGGSNLLVSRSCPLLPRCKVRENPLPLLQHELNRRLRKSESWFSTNEKFDSWVARQLLSSQSRIFMGVETCAHRSFLQARKMGMTTILDCPQVHPVFLEGLLARAADDLNLPVPGRMDSPEMAARKREEFALADRLIVLSEVERRSFIDAGIEPARLVQTTLWADPTLWFPSEDHIRNSGALQGPEPLQVLFVGSIGLRKGIPYLLRAVRECGNQVSLTLAGSDSGEIEPFLREFRECFTYVPPQSKARLREMYWKADVLVLPSLCDTFGFVAMEAMACGTPVIVSQNCGVPVPDESWRVPIMDAPAIAEKMQRYARDRDLCREDGRRAAEFARQWTPERYRAQIGTLLRSLLASST